MTIKKKILLENADATSYEDDDYYAVEKKRIAEEAQKARRIHEEDVQTHITAMIPYYEDADPVCRKHLLTLNNILIHRFSEAGMVYWGIFKHAPQEIQEYADLFGNDLMSEDVQTLIAYLQEKIQEEKNMVNIGFDEDGEEDVSSGALAKDDEYENNDENDYGDNSDDDRRDE